MWTVFFVIYSLFWRHNLALWWWKGVRNRMQTVRVRLRKPRRVLHFVCGDSMPLHRDDACIVQSDRGQEWGICVLPPEPCSESMAKRHTMRVLRKANMNDARSQELLVEEERKAYRLCFEKIAEWKMPMKLVDAEYTFDKRRIVFHFTAEDRVDFRELVRDLAQELRTRIELRHIQVRDEAKMVGGLGCCGRVLCCTSWLNDFKPISMRMAKRQNLSLNPSKISGQCGRLLCCLGYENDLYEDPRKRKKRQAEAQKDSCGECPGRGGNDAKKEDRPARDDSRKGTAEEKGQDGGSGRQNGAPTARDGQDTRNGRGEDASKQRPQRRPKRRRKKAGSGGGGGNAGSGGGGGDAGSGGGRGDAGSGGGGGGDAGNGAAR